MARPTTERQIRRGLQQRIFKPQGVPMAQLQSESISLDGLEALRLADVEGLYHQEAAERMGVSRATFARVLTAARAAVARALVDGKAIQIAGGSVAARRDERQRCPVHRRGRRRGRGCRCDH